MENATTNMATVKNTLCISLKIYALTTNMLILMTQQLRQIANFFFGYVRNRNVLTLLYQSVADPGFPRGGGANLPGGANIRFCQIFPKTA